MGNCQAVDNATLVIQHPNGRVDKHYFPVSAAEIMKINPGHYVALLLTTTLYSSAAAASSNAPLRVTRIKLLRPNDTLLLGHVYRLLTSQEVMKGLWAKKQAKMQQHHKNGNTTEKNSSDFEALARNKDDVKKNNNQERQRSRSNTQVNSGTSKSRAWQPALKSISEAAS
ncbi:uncharacterized protein LOC130992179 isoform X2 [Salvia miltiorrhiza]|uniref:uncharacterized protein LOC130992179 isoform X2 n=1 Tax=Salvia miltiorrhiza TaxID=226208 RepID=UPI0025AC8550|nr:uncharacterized protein LOC130992179 isoform X2 [Salvia miltiorrhiza]